MTRNIKVSEIVYDTLESKKQGDESFDDVLRRELNLLPDVEDLAAYLPEDMRSKAKELVSFIDGQDDFEQEIEEDIFDKLEFVSKESELPIAQVEFGEEQVRFKYRDKNGDLSTLGRITLSTSSEREVDIEEAKVLLESKISGALRKWG